MAKDKSAVIPLPPALVKSALPVAIEVMQHVAAIEKLLPTLDKQMKAAHKGGAISLARAFVVFHRLRECLCSEEKNRFKPYSILFEEYKTKICPSTFEQAGVDHVPLSEGYRVGVNDTVRATVVPASRSEAFEWMRQHHPDIVSETINSSTLSALARTLREENQELPGDLFNVADIPVTSVTKT